MDIKLTSVELAEGKALLNNIVPHSLKTICLFTFATGTKCYDTEFWRNLYGRIQNTYSHYTIFEMLPAENVSQLSFSIPSFLQQSTYGRLRLYWQIAVFLSVQIAA